MAKKKVKKVVKRRLFIFGTLSVISIVYFVFTFSYHIYELVELQNKKKELNNYYVELQENAEILEDEIEKFSDKEYLAKYARENYLYSTDNEYIIKITEDIENDIEETDLSIKKEYIIMGLSLVLVLMFIYIIKKGSNKKKK